MDTCISSLLDLRTPPTRISYPSRSSQSTELSSLCHTADSHYYFTHHSVYRSILISRFIPPFPLCARVHSLCRHLYSCPGNRFLCTIFLDSTRMHWNLKQFRALFFLTVWIQARYFIFQVLHSDQLTMWGEPPPWIPVRIKLENTCDFCCVCPE